MSFFRRFMGISDAAQYLGISASKLRDLPVRRKCIDSRRVYDRYDLDAWADECPYEGEIMKAREDDECDTAFGLKG